ncbi:MAG: zinc-dependent alcohol dehydrogenase [Thermodesulfobacteriota bacterium]
MKIRTIRLPEPEKIELMETDLPDPGEGQVLVKTFQSSICGTDRNIYNGLLPPGLKFPITQLGHEGGGTVVEVGKGVRKYKVGDRVMSCKKNGTFADYFLAREEDLHPIPPEMDLELGSLGEPLACVMYSIFNSGVQLGDTVAVMGLGFAGQIMVQGAKKKGALQVIGIDPLAGKRELAKKFGADYVFDSREEEVEKAILDLSKGGGVDVVFEAAGTEASMNMATQILKKNGTLVLYSWVMEPVRLNISRWHDDALTIKTTCVMHVNTPYERFAWFDRLLAPYWKGIIQIKPLLTGPFPLKDISQAFKVANAPDAIKVIIRD